MLLKKIILIGILSAFVSAALYSQPSSMKFEKLDKIKLSKKEISTVTKLKLKEMFILKGSYLMPAKGQTFYVSKDKRYKVLYLIPQSQSKKFGKEFSSEFKPYFEVVQEGTHAILYCSCGSRVSAVEGDSCKQDIRPDGTYCAGGCSNYAEGESCKFTLMSLEDGSTVSDMF